MQKKYHIYISSTLDDLKTERQDLSRLIYELGHIPVSMDLFDNSDPEDWELIKKNIDSSDYFIALAAHKYNLKEDKSSIIEKEYVQALKRGIPVLALIINETARWKAAKKETDPKVIKMLNAHKEQLKNHPHAFWSTGTELVQKAQLMLVRQLSLHPAAGWVRADKIVDPAIANELGRLSIENAELKTQLKLENPEIMRRLRSKMRYTLHLLYENKEALSFFYTRSENWENTRNFRYIRLFKHLAPELYVPKSVADISRFLGSILNPDLTRVLRKDFPTPSNTIKKIMADFRAFKIVKPAGETENDELWELSEYGKELYGYYRIRQFEKSSKDQNQEEEKE